MTRNIKEGMFGKVNGSVTLAGDGDCPYDITWLINQIIQVGYSDVNDKAILKEKRQYLLESLSGLEINKGYSIADNNGKLKLLILRVKDDTTFADVLENELNVI